MLQLQDYQDDQDNQDNQEDNQYNHQDDQDDQDDQESYEEDKWLGVKNHFNMYSMHGTCDRSPNIEEKSLKLMNNMALNIVIVNSERREREACEVSVQRWNRSEYSTKWQVLEI
jgi:hypothetical protein